MSRRLPSHSNGNGHRSARSAPQTTASGYTEYEPNGLLGWRKTHKNDEQTHVQVVDLEDNYAVVVIELDADERLLRSETLVAPATEEEAEEVARRYVERHEKGMARGLLSGVFS